MHSLDVSEVDVKIYVQILPSHDVEWRGRMTYGETFWRNNRREAFLEYLDYFAYLGKYDSRNVIDRAKNTGTSNAICSNYHNRKVIHQYPPYWYGCLDSYRVQQDVSVLKYKSEWCDMSIQIESQVICDLQSPETVGLDFGPPNCENTEAALIVKKQWFVLEAIIFMTSSSTQGMKTISSCRAYVGNPLSIRPYNGRTSASLSLRIVSSKLIWAPSTFGSFPEILDSSYCQPLLMAVFDNNVKLTFRPSPSTCIAFLNSID